MSDRQPNPWTEDQVRHVCDDFTNERAPTCPVCSASVGVTGDVPDAAGKHRVTFTCTGCGRATTQRFMRIGPADFVHGPFEDCPKCRQKEFGLLGVFENSYRKRCRKCMHSQEFGLPSLSKRIIYLDQLAISNMMFALNPDTPQYREGKVDPFWRACFEKLDTLMKLQLVVCPNTEVQEQESVVDTHAVSLRRLCDHFSQGVSFRDSHTIQRFQVQVHARSWLRGQPDAVPALDRQDVLHGNIDSWSDKLLISVGGRVTQEQIDSLRAARESTHDGLAGIFRQWQGQSGQKLDHWYERELAAFGQGVWSRFVEQIQRQAEIQNGTRVPTMEDFDQTYADVMITSLHRDFVAAGINEDGAWLKVREYLFSSHLGVIPSLRISSMLWAAVANRAANGGMKKPPTRGAANDVRVISTVLPFCDAIFVDNEMRNYLGEGQLKKDLDYGTRVFSFSNREEFLDYLDKRLASCPTDHIEIVERVYGPTWTSPYTNMFGEKDRISDG